MKHPFPYSIVAIALLLTGAAHGTETGTAQQEGLQMTSNDTSKELTGLPNSQGRSFSTLDRYLSHLQKMGMQDRPFYEKVGPNRYKLNVGRGGRNQPAKYFSRDELMRQYGFSK